MKKLFLILFVAVLSLPAFGQKAEATFYKKLSTQRSVHPTVKKASIGLAKNFTIRDSVVYFTRSLEKAVLKGKPGGAIKPTLIKTALKKYPGNSYKAVRSRARMYATEGKKGTTRRR